MIYFHTNGPCVLVFHRLTSRITALQIPAYHLYYTLFSCFFQKETLIESSKKRDLRLQTSFGFINDQQILLHVIRTVAHTDF